MSYVLRIFEIPYQRRFGDNIYQFDDFTNSIWLVLATITTVGYGDIIVHTYPGRLIMMLVALWGPIMISLVVLVSSSIFDLNK